MTIAIQVRGHETGGAGLRISDGGICEQAMRDALAMPTTISNRRVAT
jgi:hypothetical protein